MKIYRPDGKCNVCGSRIKKARKKANLSQEELASKLQLNGLFVTQNVISRIEIGVRIVPDYELIYLAKALGVTVYYLIGLED